MIEATNVFLTKGVRKFIKYCVRDTKNLAKSSKKTRAKELGIFLLTYSFTSEFLNKFGGFHTKKYLADFTSFQERLLPEAVT